MKNFFVFLLMLGAGIVAYSLLMDPADFFGNIISTLEIWLYKVYPPIFTFYILASLLINTNIVNKILYFLRPAFRFFRFRNEHALHLFIVSVFIGNPSSASLICESLDHQRISIDDAHDLLKYSSFLNPLFILSFMLAFIPGYTTPVILAHIVSNFLIMLCVNRKNKKTEISNASVCFHPEALLKSVNNVIYLLLMISGVMVLCSIIRYGLLSVMNSLSGNSSFIQILLANIEVSVGLSSLIQLHLPEFLTVILICFVASFGGFSIHMQVMNVIGRYHLLYRSFFLYRFIQGCLSVLLVTIFLLL